MNSIPGIVFCEVMKQKVSLLIMIRLQELVWNPFSVLFSGTSSGGHKLIFSLNNCLRRLHALFKWSFYPCFWDQMFGLLPSVGESIHGSIRLSMSYRRKVLWCCSWWSRWSLNWWYRVCFMFLGSTSSTSVSLATVVSLWLFFLKKLYPCIDGFSMQDMFNTFTFAFYSDI